jgi:hemerythrin-like domain-containing protein
MADNLVSIMVGQHRGLQKDLGNISDQFSERKINVSEISKFLKKFTKDLKEHLELENNVFYKQLLEKMKLKGQDTTKTELFIDQMKEIEKVVGTFLKKYDDLDKDNINNFKKEFKNIVDTLNIRIESEEAGVYAYWGLF